MDNFGWLETEPRPSNVAQWNEMTNFNPRQNYLPGFEGLEMVDKVFLESNLEAGSAELSWYFVKKIYKVMDVNGEELFKMIEDQGQNCYAFCCKSTTMFRAIDKYERELFRVTHTFDECKKKLVTVHDRNDEYLGYVKDVGKFWQTIYSIRDREKVEMLKINGPGLCSCTIGAEFQAISKNDETKTGVISKKSHGLKAENYKNGRTIAVCFPENLDVRIKAIMIGLALYVDFAHYRREKNAPIKNNADITQKSFEDCGFIVLGRLLEFVYKRFVKK